MAATATQTAPRAPQQGKQAQPTEQKGFKETLWRMPRAVGVALMALLLAVALVVGNARALWSVTPKAFMKQGDVASIVEDRVQAADNALTVAKRAELSPEVYAAVEAAMRAMEDADSARAISRADQKLSVAVSAMADDARAALSGEDGVMLTRALDNFSEQGSFLRQEARTYNEQALKAEKRYDSLPTRALLPEPDVYEGL